VSKNDDCQYAGTTKLAVNSHSRERTPERKALRYRGRGCDMVGRLYQTKCSR